MAKARYRVTELPMIRELFRELAFEAEKTGRLKQYLTSSKVMMSELENRPNELGESREFYKYLGMKCRVAFFHPLTVWYGVTESHKLVVITKLKLHDNKG